MPQLFEYTYGNGLQAAIKSLALLFGWLFISVAEAQSVDFAKPIQMEAGKGIVVFSITTTHTHGSPLVKWRSTREGGESGRLFTKALFGDKHLVLPPEDPRTGYLFAFSLFPGEYEFYDANLTIGQKDSILGEPEFSRKFKVVADEIHYVGNLDLVLRRSARQQNAAFGFTLILGSSVTYATAEPWLRNAADKDIPLFLKTRSEIQPSQIKTTIQTTAADTEIEKRFAALQNNAKEENIAVQGQLISAYLYGYGLQPDDSIVRTMPDHAAGLALLEESSSKGDTAAAYQLGLLYGGFYYPNIYAAANIKFKEDRSKALQYNLIAAQKYHPEAAMRMYRTLKNLDGRGDEAKAWEERADKLAAFDLKNWTHLPEPTRNALAEYASLSDFPRAFAISRAGGWGMAIGKDAGFGYYLYRAAIAKCEQNNPDKTEPCVIFAFNKNIGYDICHPGRNGIIASSGFPPLDLPKASEANFSEIVLLKDIWKKWEEKSYPKAIAIGANGIVTQSAGECQAVAKALKQCTLQGGQNCELVVADDRIVQGSEYARQAAQLPLSE